MDTPGHPLEEARVRATETTDRVADGFEAARLAVAAIGTESLACLREIERSIEPIATSDRSTATESFDHLELTVGRHVATISEVSARHAEVARDAAAQCERVLEAVARIEEVSIKAHLVGVNAAVKASKVDEGGVLHVLARRMTGSNEDVAALNEEIGRAARALAELLPRIAARAESIHRKNAAFEGFVTGEMRDARTRLSQLDDGLRRTVEESQRAVGRSLDATRRASAALGVTPALGAALDRVNRGLDGLALLDRTEDR